MDDYLRDSYYFVPGWPLFGLAVGLAMDAFAVSVVQGASRRPGWRGALAIGAAFGLAQGLMPLLGWGLGVAFSDFIRAFDHWLAFGLLLVIGGKMVREGLDRGAETPMPALIGWALFGAAIATSVDAAAAGIALPMLGTPIFNACALIGLVTAGLCFAGVRIGEMWGSRLGRIAEIAGGLVLIAIGCKILVEHLFFGG